MPWGPLDTLNLAFFFLHFKDCIFKLCSLLQSTFLLFPLQPFGLILTWVITGDSDLYLLNPLPCGKQKRVFSPSHRIDMTMNVGGPTFLLNPS